MKRITRKFKLGFVPINSVLLNLSCVYIFVMPSSIRYSRVPRTGRHNPQYRVSYKDSEEQKLVWGLPGCRRGPGGSRMGACC